MIIVWYNINLDITSDYNIFIFNFLVFICILRFGPFLASQEFLGLFTSTTHLSISTTHVTVPLYYHSSSIKNKDNARPLTIYKYKQFFATPKKQAITIKKENYGITPTNLIFPNTYFLISLKS